MSFIWNYFNLSGRIAFYKIDNCKYQKNFPPKSSTTNLATHLQHNHPEQFKEFKEKSEKRVSESNQQSIKRAFSSSAPTSSSSTNLDGALDKSSETDSEIVQITASKQFKLDIALSLRAKSPCEKDGERTSAINKAIMEFIATDIQLLSVVDNIGFRRLLNALHPKYNIPSRKYFTCGLMPNLVEKIKNRIKKDLSKVDYVSLTTDCWSSKDGAHSLFSLTIHYVLDGQPKFNIICARPIKGRHTAETLKNIIKTVLDEFDIPESKIFLVLRDENFE